MSRLVTNLGRCIGWSFELMIASLFLLLSITAVRADAATISQGYSGPADLPLGIMVSNSPTDLTQVAPATVATADNLIGVTVSKNVSAIDFASQSSIQVGTSGVFNVTVSNLNGDIRRNDRITVSPIDGVGMLTTSAGKIIGIAQQDLTTKSQASTTKTITDKQGKNHTVLIAQVPVLINVTYYQPLPPSTNSLVRSLQSFLASLAGKPISAARILLSMLFLVIGLVVALIIIFTSVGSSIRAIGRNPLSQRGVNMSLIFVILMVIMLLGGSFFSSYYILVH